MNFLLNKKANKLWEVVTLRELLEEKFSFDELYFYLHLRDIIHDGNQSRKSASKFCMFDYIDFEYAEEIIDNVLNKFDY